MVTHTTPRYNVKAVAKLVGLAPVTLRAWERRYGLPTPQRGEQGYRLYSDYDVQTLRWLKTQTDTGWSISRAAEYLNELRSSGDDPALAAINSAEAEAESAPTPGRVLQPGDVAPRPTVLNPQGQMVALSTLWHSGPVALSFLRHFGCILCREWLSHVERITPMLQAVGVRVALVGLGQPDHVRNVGYQLAPSAQWLCSPDGAAHAAYGLRHGNLLQLAGPQMMASAVRAARAGHIQGETTGHIAMLSGLFIINSQGEVRAAFYSRFAGDMPEWDALASLARAALGSTEK
jgi:DNA-binding transcriptional MerR regulator